MSFKIKKIHCTCNNQRTYNSVAAATASFSSARAVLGDVARLTALEARGSAATATAASATLSAVSRAELGDVALLAALEAGGAAAACAASEAAAAATTPTARRPARAVLARVRALARYVPALAALVARPKAAAALTSSAWKQN